MPKHNYFSSDVIFNQNFEAIEPDKGIIRGVKVCSEGEVKGHGVYANAKFIRNVTKLGKEHEVGVKARFGHPNMCATALGTYIGRYKNYRTKIEETEEGQRHHSIADLHLDETSKNLPRLGNAWDYVMQLAQSSPDMFGNSIVFTPGESEYVKIKNEDGTEDKREDVTIEVLHATDLVDEPAATDGLYSRFADEDMAMQVTTFLDQHPEVYELAVNHPNIVESFLKKYEQYKLKKEPMSKKSDETKTLFNTIKESIIAIFTVEDKEAKLPDEVNAKLTEFEQNLTELEVENTNLETKLTDSDSKIQELTGALAAKEAEITAKQSEIDAKIRELETKESEILQLQAKSTIVPGKSGAEGLDEGVTLTEAQKALEADVNMLKSMASEIRTDGLADEIEEKTKKKSE